MSTINIRIVANWLVAALCLAAGLAGGWSLRNLRGDIDMIYDNQLRLWNSIRRLGELHPEHFERLELPAELVDRIAEWKAQEQNSP